jgi:hypothetical protein
MLHQFRKLNPKLQQSKDKMEFIVVEPQMGDYIMIGALMVGSIPVAWFTTPKMTYFLVCLVFYWILAFSLWEDTYVTVLDKKENSVQITKSKFGRVEWIRAAPADELVNVFIVDVGRSRASTRGQKNDVSIGVGIHVRFWILSPTDIGYFDRWRPKQRHHGRAMRKNPKIHGIKADTRLDDRGEVEGIV